MLAQRLALGRKLRVLGLVVVVTRSAGVAEVLFEMADVAAFAIAGRRIGAAARHTARCVVDGALRRRGSDRLFAQPLFALEQRIVLQELLDFLIEFERRELQQTDRLLELRSKRQMLGQPELERMLHDSENSV